MAKSGIITVNGAQGDAVLAAALTEGDGVNQTLGALASAALENSSVKRLLAIDPVNRILRVFPTDGTAREDFETGLELDVQFSLDEDGNWVDANGVWNVVDGAESLSENAQAVHEVIKPSTPRLSLSSLIGRIEDAMLDQGINGFVIVDQETEIVSVAEVVGDLQTEITAAAVRAGVTEAAELLQTLTDDEGGNPSFAFE